MNDEIHVMNVPILPLRDVVVYPHMVIPLFVGRLKSIKALDLAMKGNKQIFLVAQKDPSVDEPDVNDFYRVGTLSTVLQLLKLPDGTVKVLVEGNQRAAIVRFLQEREYHSADIELLKTTSGAQSEIEVTIRSLLMQFEQYIKLNKRIPAEILTSLSSIDDPTRLADTIAAHVPLKIADKQKILEAISILERLELVLAYLEDEMDSLQLEKKIQNRVKKSMEKSQREYYLNEKMKAIQEELGERNDLDHLRNEIEKAGMSAEAKDKALSELKKLSTMPPMSAEATVSRNYLDWLLIIPWKKRSKVNNDLNKAWEILEKDHYGLEKIKERITEYLAVQIRAKKVKGPILCLVGPPGVGKTSLGQSIANATGREFVRISLGGIRDEAEIRGHRRTYIGSMPGKIIQKLSKAKVRNPLFMLDEVDKMAMDFRGDPASALLEVLDPEQNSAFNDHYLEVDYDLSDVMFIATANSLDIPPALLDRMEVIRLAGYTEDEKINIAMRYLIPKQRTASGLKTEEISITEQAIREIIRHYTREAGVRNIERAISKICRKVVKDLILNPTTKKRLVTSKGIEKYLGIKKFRYGEIDKDNQIGQVTALAWTEFGGELLKIEAIAIPGKGKSIFTGRLGNVMQESIHAAMTVVRSRSKLLGIPEDFFHSFDFHVHVPEGATPKDGPSAGIGMCTALVSTLTRIPVKANVAMTGEITLRGEALPIGGLKEKLIAALRGRVKTVIIPAENKRDLKEIPKNITQNLDIRPVRWIDEVLEIALEHLPEIATEDQEVLVVHGDLKNSKKLKQERESAH
jgi:ATP-dependent Lon protease